MNVLSILSSITWKQVALGSATTSAVSLLGASYFSSRLITTVLSNLALGRKINTEPEQEFHVKMATLFLLICSGGLVSLSCAGLKGTYNWIRS